MLVGPPAVDGEGEEGEEDAAGDGRRAADEGDGEAPARRGGAELHDEGRGGRDAWTPGSENLKN